MNALASAVAVAQASLWEAMGSRFAPSRGFGAAEFGGVLLILVGLGLAVWLAVWADRSRRSLPKKASPQRLFAELAAAHGLTRSQRRDCQRAAEAGGLAEAAELFVRPHLRPTLEAIDSGLAARLFGPLDAQGEKR